MSVMEPSSKPDLIPTISILAILAVAFSALAGLAVNSLHRNLFTAGAGFCLLILCVVWMFLATKLTSHSTHSGISAAYGALIGLCYGLCFALAATLLTLILTAAAGALVGYIGYWGWVMRSGAFWRDD